MLAVSLTAGFVSQATAADTHEISVQVLTSASPSQVIQTDRVDQRLGAARHRSATNSTLIQVRIDVAAADRGQLLAADQDHLAHTYFGLNRRVGRSPPVPIS